VVEIHPGGNGEDDKAEWSPPEGVTPQDKGFQLKDKKKGVAKNGRKGIVTCRQSKRSDGFQMW